MKKKINSETRFVNKDYLRSSSIFLVIEKISWRVAFLEIEKLNLLSTNPNQKVVPITFVCQGSNSPPLYCCIFILDARSNMPTASTRLSESSGQKYFPEDVTIHLS